MPELMIVDPGKIGKSGTIKINDSPLNQYKPDFSKEKKELGDTALKNIYIHVRTIREFETALDHIKNTGSYSGISYNYKGPVLLDTLTYRISGHSPSDTSGYRSREEMEMWENIDCVRSFGDYLKVNGVYSAAEIEKTDSEICARMKKIILLAIDDKKSPFVKSEILDALMFSNRKIEKMADREPEVLMPSAENPRVRSLARKSRYGINEDGNRVSQSKVFACRDAFFEAMRHRFFTDPTMAAWGGENRDWSGAFAVYRGLTDALSYHRLFNSPISEGAIAGTGQV